jgi:hypothetical protein
MYFSYICWVMGVRELYGVGVFLLGKKIWQKKKTHTPWSQLGFRDMGWVESMKI